MMKKKERKERKNCINNFLLTVEDVAKYLKTSQWYVYQHSKELNGFYLPGSRLLRFRKGGICECLEGKNGNVDVSIQVSGKETRKERVQDQKKEHYKRKKTTKRN